MEYSPVNNDLIIKALENSLVIDLINGNIVSGSTVDEYLGALNLKTCPNNVLIINIDDLNSNISTNNREGRFIRASILKTIKQIAKSINGIAIMGPKGNIIVVFSIDISQNEYKQSETALKIGRKLLELFNKETGLIGTIGIGRAVSSFYDMPRSYEEAIKALKNRFFLGSYKAIHINDVMDYDENVLECFLEKESILTAKVRVGDEEGALSALKELLDEIYKQNGIDTDMLKVRILELLTVISRAAIDGGADRRTILELKVKYGDEISSIENQDKFEEWICRAFSEVIGHVKVNQQIEAIKAIKIAQNYIDENYSKQITLESTADYVHLSTYYFSHLFKKEMGMTFIEYLTKKRIEKARQLLLTKDMSILNIAREVGYWDANYFGKVFKSIVGVTPSQCRKGIIDKA